MKSTYDDALSPKAYERLSSQYGFGAKRYGTIASWKTILKSFFYDIIGNSIPDILYKTNHPAQLHYGFWNLSTRSFDDSIRNATSFAFSKLQYEAPRPALRDGVSSPLASA